MKTPQKIINHNNYLRHREKRIENNLQYYWQNHGEISRKRYQYKIALKSEVFSRYSMGLPKCVSCGVTDIDILCIDHINGGGNSQRRTLGISGSTAFYRWLRENNYPDGYQILCMNCNMKKRAIRREFYANN